MRWFDIPGLLRYADWVNFLSYNLHGYWDSNTAVGNHVAAHTNLTEIKLAFELLWRVNVLPQQISLGLGFYGNSFELLSPSCSTPGCLFRAAGQAGMCTQTPGTLDYFEIQAILQQNPSLEPVYDVDAAVKYVVYGEEKRQWVSYDDGETFKQKLDCDNSVGVGGVFIWSLTGDDASYTAFSGLIGSGVSHSDLEPRTYDPIFPIGPLETYQLQVGQGCYLEDCKDITFNPLLCPDDYTYTGNDRGGCGKGPMAKPICCPTGKAPNVDACTWRGGTGGCIACNGQCHVTEATLFGSSWGGGFKNESDDCRCGSGQKVFCCKSVDFLQLIAGCEWALCGQSCPPDKHGVFTKYDWCMENNQFLPIAQYQQVTYCCPTNTPITNCSWHNDEDASCSNSICQPDQIAFDLDYYGDRQWSCEFGHKKVRLLQRASTIGATSNLHYHNM